nr:tripartite tricarboxylate transporter substrate-binding protein [Cupriavidus sp. L7L]
MTEVGYPVIVENWTGLLMPVGTSRPIVDKVATSASRMLASETVRNRIIAADFTLAPQNGLPFAEYFSAEVTRWAKLMEEKHITVE